MSHPERPVGWYRDPEVAGCHRYWDGENWVEHRAPSTSDEIASAPTTHEPASPRAQSAGNGDEADETR